MYIKNVFSILFSVLVFVSCENKEEKEDPSTTIYRDRHGVAHVYGKDDQAAAFGFGYAMAEDNFDLILRNYIMAVGRSTELIGEQGIMDDWINRSMEIEKRAREEFKLLSPEVQAICTGYVAGLNHYVQTHPEAKLQVIDQFEPWHPLAFISYVYYQRVLLPAYSKIPRRSLSEAFEWLNPEQDNLALVLLNRQNEGEGSNSWAVNGSKSASGNAMLFINPHLPWFGAAQVYEGHIMSGSGWNFTGYTRFGFPLPYVGHGEHIGWASTDYAADLVDTYFEYFNNPEDSLSYAYEGGFRKATKWSETILIKTTEGWTEKELIFMKTHHGPVLSYQDKLPVAVRMSKFETPGWLEQWYLMTKAENLEEFRKAVSMLEVQFGNFMYADQQGNIWYVYNGAIPKRNEKYDWEKPLDGSIANTEWEGYHTLEELPQIFNPSSHWMQNCNGTPVLGSAPGDAPEKQDFPKYMIVEPDNERSQHSRRILSEVERFTYESFTDSSYSTYMISTEWDLPRFREESRNLSLTEEEKEALDILNTWDGVSRLESVATTLYVLSVYNAWLHQGQTNADTSFLMTGLRMTLADLQTRRGDWRIPWGDFHRMQRPANHISGSPHFNDSIASIGVAGAPSWTGSIFIVNANPDMGENKNMYGEHGNSYVSIVEFGDRIRSGSLHPFGPNGNPEGPNFFGESALFSKGEYKESLLYLDDVVRNAVKTYTP